MVRALPSEPDAAPPPPRPSEGLVAGLARVARPRQWTKNVLVFAAPGAAGVLGHGGPFGRAAAGFAIFCVAASGTYFLNDAVDAEADRHHPVKRTRPVAAGTVTPAQALMVGGALMAGALGGAWALAGGQMLLVVALYLALSAAYSLTLKHMPVLDLAALSGGFILRAIAGGVATGVKLSDWFVIVATFGSLLVATGKRSAEHHRLGVDGAKHRPVLEAYPPAFLRSVRLLAAAITITAYCLWAFERAVTLHHSHPIFFQLSIAPVVLAVLYLELQFELGGGGAPEEMALRDRTLQALAVAWIVLFAIGIYG